MLNRKTYLIRWRVGFLKSIDTYDILDPETGQHLGIAKVKVSPFIWFLGLFAIELLLPTTVYVYEGQSYEDESKLLLSIRRGIGPFGTKVVILDKHGEALGFLRKKVFSLGGAFYVIDMEGQKIAYIKGNWKGLNFSMTDNNEREIGSVTKKWTGLGKEMFTSDSYIISLNEEPASTQAILLLAAGLAVDTILSKK